LEHKLSDATRSGDQALLDELYGKRLLILGVPYTKEQWIELVVKGKGTFVSIEKSVIHVKIYGDTAITMGMQYVDSKTANGGQSYQHGFMNTWIRSKNGKWECVAAAADQIR
jgi:ketosteroid isomerase-like protein